MKIQQHIKGCSVLLTLLVLISCRNTPKLDVKYQPLPYVNQEKDELDESDANDHVLEEKSSWNKPSGSGYEITPGNSDESWDYYTAKPLTFKHTAIEEVKERRFGPIYFAYNQSYIGETERQKLEKLADYLLRNSQFIVIVEGHCDERGSEEYNRALGEKRALSVRDYLAKLGVGLNRMNTVSYGEARPVYTGELEEAHAQNRRAELIIGLPKN